MPLNTFNYKSMLIQLMTWCHQATSHYLSWCSLRSLLPYGVIRPQWVKVLFTFLPPIIQSFSAIWPSILLSSSSVNDIDTLQATIFHVLVSYWVQLFTVPWINTLLITAGICTFCETLNFVPYSNHGPVRPWGCPVVSGIFEFASIFFQITRHFSATVYW